MKLNLTLFFVLFYFIAFAQDKPNEINFVKDNYTKKEVYIPVRDGVKLFTVLYIPKDISKENKYPFLMQRTCYSVGPYGEDQYKENVGPNKYLMGDKYIFVYQDIRGRFMSEGTFTNMTPQVEHKSKKNVDESTDTYDTIDWLLKNIKNNTGKVGQYGTSYPGFYTAVGVLSGHPALVASSPQAPISDIWNDDFSHNGKFTLAFFRTFPVFGVQKTKPEKEHWYLDSFISTSSEDGLKFYRELGTLREAYEKFYKDNFFMSEIMNHPSYDTFWQSRSLLPHLKNVTHAVMTVGGWFDAEDLSGPLNIYKTIEKTSPNAKNTIVMGPFSHGAWAQEPGHQYHNDIYFGDSLATYYQKNIESKFFNHYLKGNNNEEANLPEALMYDTGSKECREFDVYPPKEAKKVKFYLVDGSLKKSPEDGFSEYFSDPNNPVLSSVNLKEFNGFTPRNYMSEDQRFAIGRPDVLTFTTDVLTEDITFAGEITADLNIASTSTDADFAVKLIDVYPEDFVPVQGKEGVIYNNYHQMVRSEIMPARFRNSREKPEALIPNEKTTVDFRLQDVVHTFKKGHKIQVQVRSTWFPLFSINPQKYLDNPNMATKEDYTKAFIKLFGDSALVVDVIE